MIDNTRLLKPAILQTKEELLMALRQGELKTSKYNLLSEVEKIYVELVCFGGYTGEQAIKAIDPSVRSPAAAANRMMANPDVVATLEELSVAKDRKFQAEIQSKRDMALEKLTYIMSTTQDEALAVSCAKILMDKAETASKQITQKDEQVGAVKFNIQVENLYVPGAPIPKAHKEEPVIIELTDEEMAPEYQKISQENALLKQDNVKLKKMRGIDDKRQEVNPETGLPYTLVYEGMDNYK